MFNGTLRRQLLFSYLAVVTVLIVIVGIFMFVVVAASARTRIQPQLQDLVEMNRRTASELRELRTDGVGRGNFLEDMQESLYEISRETNSRIYIVNSNLVVIFDSWDRITGDLLEYEPLNPNVTDGVIAGQNSEFGRVQDAGGGRAISISQGIFRGGNNNNGTEAASGELRLIHAIPESTAVQTFRNFFFLPLLGVSGVGLVLALFFAGWISRSVARPLQAAAAAAHRIAEGDYEQKLEPMGPHEVRTLMDSFNTMSAQVSHTNQAQKDFVANVSHDLKTPLTSIQGWSQAILDGAAETPQARQRAATIIHSESERMDRMVNQLLVLAKLEAGKLEATKELVEMTDLVRNVRRALLFQAQEKGLSLETDIQFESAVVFGDGDQITQLLTNLVQNGMNHTPEGGRVLLRLRRGKEDNQVRLSVRDTGIGISPENLERVFERFYQVDKSRTGKKRGTGLGLAIVQHIVESHDGAISAKSELGKGSEFIATFPLYRGAS